MNFYNEFTKQWRSHFTRDEVPHVNCLKADQFKNVPDQMEALKRAERDVNTNVAVLQEKLSKQIFLRDHLVKYREKLSAIAAVLQQMDGSVVKLAFPECGGAESEDASGSVGAYTGDSGVGASSNDSGPPGKLGVSANDHHPPSQQTQQATGQSHSFKTESSDDFHNYEVPVVTAASVMSSLASIAADSAACTAANCTAACTVNCTAACSASCAASCAAANCAAAPTAGPLTTGRHAAAVTAHSSSSSSSSSSSTSSGCGPMPDPPTGPLGPPNAAAAAMMLDGPPPTAPGVCLPPSSLAHATSAAPSASPTCHVPPLPPHSMAHSGTDFGQPLPPLPPPMPPHSSGLDIHHPAASLLPPHTQTSISGPSLSVSSASSIKCDVATSSHNLPNFMAAALASAAAAAAAGGNNGDMKPPHLSHGNFLFPKRRRYFACQVCGKRYSSKAAALIHMRTHTGERPFVCNECGRAFRQKAQLIQHERIHSGEKPYMCEVCEKSFRQKSHLDQHMHTHLTVKPFYCDKCGKAFRRKRGLLAHQERQICEGRVNDLSGLIEEVVPVECPDAPQSILCPPSLPPTNDMTECPLGGKEETAFLLGE